MLSGSLPTATLLYLRIAKRKEMVMEDNNRGMLLFGFGCAAGIAGTLLLTSRSGRETVAYLRDKAEEGTQTVKDGVDNLSSAVTQAAER